MNYSGTLKITIGNALLKECVIDKEKYCFLADSDYIVRQMNITFNSVLSVMGAEKFT